jgi:hypothetical protein
MSSPTNPNQFTELRPEPLQSTLDRLQRRIDERFVGSGLGQVALGLRALSDDVVTLVERLRKPVWTVRIAAAVAAVALLVVTALVIASAAHSDDAVSTHALSRLLL